MPEVEAHSDWTATCKQCRANIHPKAKKCPHCGAQQPNPALAIGCMGVLCAFGLLILVGMCASPDDKGNTQRVEPVEKPSGPATLKPGYFACLTEEAFDQVLQALVRGDKRGAQYLVEQDLCIVTAGGQEFSLLETGWTGQVKIRVYTDAGAVELWTNIEAVQ